MSGALIRAVHAAGDLEKVAWRRLGMVSEKMPFEERKWSEKFRSTPFYDRAVSLEKSAEQDRVTNAQRRIEHAKQELDDAKFDAKITDVEQKLLDWKHSFDGKEKRAFAEKLAECRHKSFKEWSDCFVGSPFYKVAMALDVEDAQRAAARERRYFEDRQRWNENDKLGIQRADLEAEYASWRYEQMGLDKTAAAHFAFIDQGSGMFTDNTVAGFSAELEAIEKIANAGRSVSRGAAAGLAAVGLAGGAAAGGLAGHKRGEREGRVEGHAAGRQSGFQQGVRQGYMAGAKRGFTAGQIATIKRLKALQAAKTSSTKASSKSSKEKTAVVGWAVDGLNLGVPSAAGYVLGRTDKPGDLESAEEAVRRKYNIGAGALIPGYTGYHAGRKSRAQEALETYRRKAKKKKKGKEKKAGVKKDIMNILLGKSRKGTTAAAGAVNDAANVAINNVRKGTTAFGEAADSAAKIGLGKARKGVVAANEAEQAMVGSALAAGRKGIRKANELEAQFRGQRDAAVGSLLDRLRKGTARFNDLGEKARKRLAEEAKKDDIFEQIKNK